MDNETIESLSLKLELERERNKFLGKSQYTDKITVLETELAELLRTIDHLKIRLARAEELLVGVVTCGTCGCFVCGDDIPDFIAEESY